MRTQDDKPSPGETHYVNEALVIQKQFEEIAQLRQELAEYKMVAEAAEQAEMRYHKDCVATQAALREYGQHKPNCAINITRHADDSAAYLSEKCTCGFDRALGAQATKPVDA